MAKVAKEGIFLVSTSGSGHFYTIRRNKKKKGGVAKKLEMMKYDPVARKRVLYKEGKLSKLKKKFNPPQSKSSQPKTTETQAAETQTAA